MKKTATKQTPVLVVSGRVVQKNSKIDWPDLNFPNSGQTILRTVHEIDYDGLKVHLDGPEGPWFESKNLPEGVGFFVQVK
jgi:hypothetical protein